MNETDTQVKKTKEEIDQEYSRIAMLAGDLEFKRLQLDRQLDEHYHNMNLLNIDAGKVLEEEKNKK